MANCGPVVGKKSGNYFRRRSRFWPPTGPTKTCAATLFRLQYGPFRYFTGGDLPGTPDPEFPAWHALEAAIAPVIGRTDVHVVNQHGSMGEESEAFLETLRSTVLIVPSWAPSHPAPDVLKRIVNSRLPPSPRYVFATDLREAAKIVIGQRAAQINGPATSWSGSNPVESGIGCMSWTHAMNATGSMRS